MISQLSVARSLYVIRVEDEVSKFLFFLSLPAMQSLGETFEILTNMSFQLLYICLKKKLRKTFTFFK